MRENSCMPVAVHNHASTCQSALLLWLWLWLRLCVILMAEIQTMIFWQNDASPDPSGADFKGS